jgi:hypothetical protein
MCHSVKQEIFFSDVNTCVASLKKAVDELRTLGEAQLQMAQPTFRSVVLTVVPGFRVIIIVDQLR